MISVLHNINKSAIEAARVICWMPKIPDAAAFGDAVKGER